MQPFNIIFTKRVVFRDMCGTVLKVYEVEETCRSTYKSEHGYFVTSMGGVWFDEATEE